jgi:hypothetical protein
MMLWDRQLLCEGGGGVVDGAPQETKPHGFCSPPSGLFHPACGGHLLIGNIHLRPVLIEVNGKSFWRSLPTWGIL